MESWKDFDTQFGFTLRFGTVASNVWVSRSRPMWGFLLPLGVRGSGFVVVFNNSLLSKSEDLDLVNKFRITFIMTKQRISLASVPDMCSAAALLAVQTVQTQPPGNGQGVWSSQQWSVDRNGMSLFGVLSPSRIQS